MTTPTRDTCPVVDFDLFASATRDASDEALQTVRDTGCPVVWTERNGGHWIVSSYEMVAAAFRDWERFSSERIHPEQNAIAFNNSKLPPCLPEESDPPRWYGYRRALAVILSPQASERLRSRARFWTRHYLDQVVERGECDFVHDLTCPVPAAVTLEWLGYPRGDWEMFSDAFHGVSAYPAGSPEHRKASEAYGPVLDRIAEELRDRIATPRDDALTAIAHHEVDGERLPEDIAKSITFLTTVGGIDTTTSLTGAALLHLSQHHDDRRRLIEDPGLLPMATEEFLRFYPPARAHKRIVAADTEFGGVQMKRGDSVLLSEVAAGRDDAEFPDADQFVLDRNPNRHVSFGVGIHRCPGSHLARIVFAETITAVLERMPDYEIALDRVEDYPDWAMVGGWSRMPATFTPTSREPRDDAVTTVDFADADFFRNRALTQDPNAYYDWLRDQGRVWREPKRGVVMVSGYDEAIAVYHDAASFSSCNTVAGPFFPFPVALEGDDISAIIEEHRDTLPFTDQLPSFDPPKHTDHRALLMRLITPKRLKENEEFMWRLCDQTLDEFFPRGECEFVKQYALPFTFLVVADLLGVPEEDRDTVRVRLVDKKRAEEMSHAPLEYLYAQFTTYIEDRRREPRDDVMTGLATATFPDGRLPEVDDVMRIAANLFSAGGETTARLMSTSFRVLGDRPDLQLQLREEPDKIPAFMEEALRLENPIKGEFRLARVPVTIGGLDFPAGTCVWVMNSAANRDPRQFEDPHEFRLDRANGRAHIAFGHGIHSCAGAPLARAETRVTIERFLARTDDIQISEAAHGPIDARRYEYDPTYMLRGLRELHLEFTPVS